MLISILQLLISISFQFLLCSVIHSLIFTFTNTFISTYNFNFEGLNNFCKTCKYLQYMDPPNMEQPPNVDSTIDPSDTKEETTIEDKSNVVEEQEGTESTYEKEPEQDELPPQPPTKSPSYTLYIATLIAVLGAAASLVQTNCCFNSFLEEFTSGLCTIDNADEGANQALEEAAALHRGLSSIFDPVLKEGENYDALSAIKSRYIKTFFW